MDGRKMNNQPICLREIQAGWLVSAFCGGDW
jgi:hypothetical protein